MKALLNKGQVYQKSQQDYRHVPLKAHDNSPFFVPEEVA